MRKSSITKLMVQAERWEKFDEIEWRASHGNIFVPQVEAFLGKVSVGRSSRVEELIANKICI